MGLVIGSQSCIYCFFLLTLLLQHGVPPTGYHPSQSSSMWALAKGWSPSGMQCPSVGPTRKPDTEGSSFLQSIHGMLQGLQDGYLLHHGPSWALRGESASQVSSPGCRFCSSTWSTSLLSSLNICGAVSPSCPSHPFPSTLRGATSVNDWLSLGCAELPEMGSVQRGAAPRLFSQKPSLQLPAPNACHINPTQTCTQ